MCIYFWMLHVEDKLLCNSHIVTGHLMAGVSPIFFAENEAPVDGRNWFETLCFYRIINLQIQSWKKKKANAWLEFKERCGTLSVSTNKWSALASFTRSTVVGWLIRWILCQTIWQTSNNYKPQKPPQEDSVVVRLVNRGGLLPCKWSEAKSCR